MQKFAAFTCAVGLLAFAGCTMDSEESAQGRAPAPRTISPELRSRCQELVAPEVAVARISEEPVLEIDTVKAYTLLDSIYDASGALIGVGSIAVSEGMIRAVHSESGPYRLGILWNGVDSTGRPVKGGNYFLFSRLLDEAGQVSMVDSVCVGIVRGAGD